VSIVRSRTKRSTVAQASGPTSASFFSRTSVVDFLEVVDDRGVRAEVEELVDGHHLGPHAHPAELEHQLGHPVARRVVTLAEVARNHVLEVLVEERPDGLGQVLVAEDLVALGVDRLALAVDDVVELDDALADVEVEALDARLGALDRLADEARLDVVVVRRGRVAPSWRRPAPRRTAS